MLLTPRRQKVLDDFREQWIEEIEAKKVAALSSALTKITLSAQPLSKSAPDPMNWEPTFYTKTSGSLTKDAKDTPLPAPSAQYKK
jgi:hypothetical protein